MREQIGLLSIITIAKIAIGMIFPNLIIHVDSFCLPTLFILTKHMKKSENSTV